MNTLSNLMFWISSGFLVPVVVALLYFFVRSLLLLGDFVSKYVRRMRMEKELNAAMENLNEGNVRELKFSPEISSQALASCIHRIIGNSYNEAVVNKTVSEYELARGKELDQAKILVKFGPILGLMGTLIPMGPALAGLSSGDIASMAYNMQVAFATTVLGLFAGAVGFVLYQTKQRWAQKDLVRLDFVSQLMKQSQNA
ncbi:MAG: MotA/TolQ/ExbB proton channel family protein [Bacteroidales bacterium]|nr:MotA/TolQ/ExbB proton channel family protein [Bacteroidales bacterium]